MIFYTFKTHKTQKTNVLIYKDHFLFVICSGLSEKYWDKSVLVSSQQIK